MPLVTASWIALSSVVLLLVTSSGLFSWPLLILLCCLISKALPCRHSVTAWDNRWLFACITIHFRGELLGKKRGGEKANSNSAGRHREGLLRACVCLRSSSKQTVKHAVNCCLLRCLSSHWDRYSPQARRGLVCLFKHKRMALFGTRAKHQGISPQPIARCIASGVFRGYSSTYCTV